MTQLRFFTDFDRFTGMMKSGVPFALGRFADGEVALMQGRSIGPETQAGMVDRWTAPDRMTLVGQTLLHCLDMCDENYYCAISAPTDSLSDYLYLHNRIKRVDNITFANLWINANYTRMLDFYQSVEGAYVICNHRANRDAFPFHVRGLFPVPDDIVNWVEAKGIVIDEFWDFRIRGEGHTVFVAAGPLSAIIVYMLHRLCPGNQYVDVGSSMDEFIHGRKTRPYMNPGSHYAHEISKLPPE